MFFKSYSLLKKVPLFPQYFPRGRLVSALLCSTTYFERVVVFTAVQKCTGQTKLFMSKTY